MDIDFWPGFLTGAVSAGFLIVLAVCISSEMTGSSVTVVGYRQQQTRRVYVGDDLWVRDFTYDVSPSNVLVTITFAPKNKVRE